MKIIEALKLLAKETGAEVYLVGGYVRDFLRRKENRDVDVVIRYLSLTKAAEFLKDYGKCKIITLSQARETEFKTLLFRHYAEPEYEAQITLPRRGKLQIADKTNSLKQDSKYRDFKLNAIYLPINFETKQDVIDYVGGVKDIKDHIISPITTAEDCFMVSPVRMLRAVRLAATTGYRISDDLIVEMKKDADKILTVPPEVIRAEFDRILLSTKPSRYIRLLQKVNLLKYFLPELDRCVGVKQDLRYHKFDVFTHCAFTVDHLENDLILRLSGLLHDIGKPDTRKEVREGKEVHVTFHKHELESTRLARQFLERLRYDNDTKEQVLNLIRMHMYHYTRDYTDAAVRRFIKKASIDQHNLKDLSQIPLFKLRAGERQGNGLKKEPVTQRQVDFENRIRAMFDKGGTADVGDLDINGHIIIEAFDLKPGKHIGELLNYLVDKIREDRRLNNRFDLLQLSLNYLKSRGFS
jgi:tRNA nucleotidyltransferase (CCA-adding enzyme)